MNLQVIRGTATGIIQQAGAEVMLYYDQPHTETTKSSMFDIVTEGDKASERLIVAALCEAFPDHHIVGEEGGGMGAPAEEAEYFWYIDPIDGTSNFANNIPFFSISMALADKNLNPLVGVVLNPVSHEIFSAVAGQGVTRNGLPIRVSDTESLSQAILCSGFPYDTATQKRINVDAFMAFLPQTRGVRRIGSAALELSYVACGRLDGFWECRLNPWDCMAGILLVREAGGKVTDYQGGEAGLTGAELIASNGLLHEAMRTVITANP
ncbi:MAG: inositol monophosphatase [Anaerolineae bacterium]|nr:inositol monophosphatase [Anaerolineae bacterium]